jgi:ribonuclease HII
VKSFPDLSREQAHGGIVCGVDEVGRGPLAGPLVAAAVILDPAAIPDGIRDSKALTVKRRDLLAPLIRQAATHAVGVVEAEELDRIGLTAANDLAMARAIAGLPVRPVLALVDGRRVPKGLPCEAQAVIKGDTKSLSIAAASIVAKVHRDAVMQELAARHPGYGWETNVGYPTAAHREALKTLGITREHRRSFAPVARMHLNKSS